MMRIIFLCLLLPIFCAAKSSSPDSTTEKNLDLDYNEDNVIIRERLFTKINTILGETTTQREIQNKLLVTQNSLSESVVSESQRKDNEWTTIFRRQDGSFNFYRNWAEYQKGFGNPDGEFFIGLEKLHAMTAMGAPQELMVILKGFKNETGIAKYDIFQIGNETEKYALKELVKYSGDTGDSLSCNRGRKFSTYDNYNGPNNHNSAEHWNGAWWYGACYQSHLFGPYTSEEKEAYRGIIWGSWKGLFYSVKFAEMKIRSLSF